MIQPYVVVRAAKQIRSRSSRHIVESLLLAGLKAFRRVVPSSPRDERQHIHQKVSRSLAGCTNVDKPEQSRLGLLSPRFFDSWHKRSERRSLLRYAPWKGQSLCSGNYVSGVMRFNALLRLLDLCIFVAEQLFSPLLN